MSLWRRWWRSWLAAYAQARHPGDRETPSAEREDDMPPGQAAALLSAPTAREPANNGRLAAAARRLQRQLGNRGVQLLAQQPGEPVPPGLRTEMSAQLGDDLADVRLHTGSAGAAIARAAGARAVTVGRDVAFESGAYAPDTPAGHQLLAHELAHTVQAGEGSGRDPTVLEREARSQGRPTPGAAAPGQILRDEEQSWRERVRAARAETDPGARRQALIALVREALAGFTIHIAPPTPTSGPVRPDQYQPAPAINFDFYLEQKEHWPGAGRQGQLGPRTGYFFSTGGRAYAIIGPRASEESTPILTRMHADHELFHAQHHVGSQAPFNDRELEAWTNDFVNYFHQVYRARKSWRPLIQYYEGASVEARERALRRLVDYFNGQPANIQQEILAWLRRRQRDMADKLLVQHLAARIGRTGPGRSAPASPPPTPP
jgi:hypothetical protein